MAWRRPAESRPARASPQRGRAGARGLPGLKSILAGAALFLIGAFFGIVVDRHRALPRGVQGAVDSGRVVVAAAETSSTQRQHGDARARIRIANLEAGAAQEQASRILAEHRADSLLALLRADTLPARVRDRLDGLEALRDQERASAQRQVDTLTTALHLAERRWFVADSMEQARTRQLREAQDRLEKVARRTRRCGLGAAGPIAISQQGFNLGLAAGVSCRM